MKKLVYLFSLLCLTFATSIAQTTYTVSSTANNGPNTLRDAITRVNSGTGLPPYTIAFTTSGPISLTTLLPAIIRSCTLVGASTLNVNTGLGGTTIERNLAMGNDAPGTANSRKNFRLFDLSGLGNQIAFVNLTLTNGYPDNDVGGAIRSVQSDVSITSCLIRGNSAGQGGGVWVQAAGLVMNDTHIVGNNAYSAPAVYFQEGRARITNCQITDNSGLEGAGLDFVGSCSAVVVNTRISSNTAIFNYSAIQLRSEIGNTVSVTLLNCTITDNKVLQSNPDTGGQGTVFIRPGGGTNNLTVLNTIITGNTFEGSPADITGTVSLASNHNLIGAGGGLTDGINGNQIGLDKNPYFRNVVARDFQLAGCSPAINAGDPATTPALVGAVDLARNSRFFNGGQVDIGAYEFQREGDNGLPISYSVLGSGTATCASSPTITLSGSQTGVSYQLRRDATNMGSPVAGTGSTLSFGPQSLTGTYTVQATATDAVCTVLMAMSATVISNLEAPTLTISPGNSTLTCSVTSLTLTALGNGASYLWTGGNTSATLSVSAPGTYSVTATAANGCTSTTSIIVNQDLAAPGSPSATLSCDQTGVTVTATPTGEGLSYLFAGPSGVLAGSGNMRRINVAGTYTVLVTNTATGCSSQTTLSITPGVAPNALLLGSGNLSCTTPTLTLTALGGSRYHFSGPVGGLPGVVSQTDGRNCVVVNGYLICNTPIPAIGTAVVNKPGTYTVLVTGEGGCTSTATIVVTGTECR